MLDAVSVAERLALSMVQEALQAGSTAVSNAINCPAVPPVSTSNLSVISTTAAPVLPCSPPTMLTVRRELNPAVSFSSTPNTAVALSAPSSLLSLSTPCATASFSSTPVSGMPLTSTAVSVNNTSITNISGDLLSTPPLATLNNTDLVASTTTTDTSSLPQEASSISQAEVLSASVHTPMMMHLLDREEDQELRPSAIERHVTDTPWMPTMVPPMLAPNAPR